MRKDKDKDELLAPTATEAAEAIAKLLESYWEETTNA